MVKNLPAGGIRDSGSIPRSGSSNGERIGYPFHYSRVSLVAQMAKNLPAIWETWVRSLSREDPGEGNIYPFLPREFRGQRSLESYSPWDCHGSLTTDQLSQRFLQ